MMAEPAPETAGTGTRVLAVDDDASVRELIQATLAVAGFDVITAGDGLHAVELAVRERPKVVVLDVMMPGLDGFEVASRLRGEPDPPAVLFLTARDNSQDRRRAAELSADYLTKPFALTDLIARVRALTKRDSP